METLVISLVVYLVGCIAVLLLIKSADKHNNKTTPPGDTFVWVSMSWALIYTLVLMLVLKPLVARLKLFLK